MRLRPVRILTVLTFGLALSLLFPGYATGQPSNDIRARAAQLERDLNASNQRVAALAQQLQAAQMKVEEAEARAQDAQDLTARSKYSDLAAGRDESLVEQLAAQRAELDKARAEAAAERDALASAKAEAESAATTQQQLLDQV